MESNKIILEDIGAVAILRLNNGVTNAISPKMLADFSHSIIRIKASFSGAVLTGGEKFFSIGLDIPSLLPLHREEMREFWYAFDRAVLDFFTLPFPTACAIRGHAVAGGSILALACDFRFAASGRKLVGFNEVKLGVPVPFLADLMLRQVVGDRAASKMLFSGDLSEAKSAVTTGFIDGVYPEIEVEKRALEKIADLAGHPGEALAAIKDNRVSFVRERFESLYRQKTEEMLDIWFNSKAQSLLAEAAKKF